jgi:hypothetical protein
MLETFDQSRLESADPFEISDALEQGNIVYFPECPVPLTDEGDLSRMRDELPGQLTRKNASYHPESDSVSGLDASAPVYDLAYRVLTSQSDAIVSFLEKSAPNLIKDATIGTSSFRPVEEKDRNLKAHASSELIHVDAGTYGATNGDRILRFIINVNPSMDRVWATKGSFPEVFARYGERAGLSGPKGTIGRLDKNVLDKLRTSAINGISRIGLPMAKVLDSTPYDRVMRRFHNFMKDTPEFQRDPAGYEEIHFRPYSAWMVFADGVSHACLSGQHAFIWTCLTRLRNSRFPELAPINVLRNAA